MPTDESHCATPRADQWTPQLGRLAETVQVGLRRPAQVVAHRRRAAAAASSLRASRRRSAGAARRRAAHRSALEAREAPERADHLADVAAHGGEDAVLARPRDEVVEAAVGLHHVGDGDVALGEPLHRGGELLELARGPRRSPCSAIHAAACGSISRRNSYEVAQQRLGLALAAQRLLHDRAEDVPLLGRAAPRCACRAGRSRCRASPAPARSRGPPYG